VSGKARDGSVSGKARDGSPAVDTRPGGDWSIERMESGRLLLRPWTLADAPAVQAACSDLETQRWLRLPSPYTLADAERWVTEGGHILRRAGSGIQCAVVERWTEQLVGSCEVRMHPTRRSCVEIGYWIAPWARGRRYGAEAIDRMCRWCYKHGVARVELLAAVPNVVSQRVALRAGFLREGVVRSAVPLATESTDAVLFSRLATDTGTPTPRPLPDVNAFGDGVVVVRPLRAGDEDAALDERSDYEARRWATGPRPWTRRDVERLVQSAASAWLAGTEARFAVVDGASGEYVGSVGLRLTVPAFAVAEVGYGMRARWRRRGYMTRALALVDAWAFHQAGLARLELGTAADNVASQRTAERAGFVREGVARLRLPTPDGRRVDEVRYGLARRGGD
jgi:RimJ/RimL family protein N-acetyltransferase